MEIFEQLKQAVEGIAIDVEKFYTKGNSAAGTRVRKAMQEIKQLAQALRVNIQETKNAAE